MVATGSCAARVPATRTASSGSGSASTPGSITTSQWQWGWRSAGRRGGRWIGVMRARGSVAHAVASKVGSSMWWHMATT